MRKRVSDDWSVDERRTIIRIFLERVDEAVKLPLFEHQDINDPNGGYTFKIDVTINKNTNHQSTSLKIYHYDMSVYNEAIRLLRPLLLSSEEIFLPKVTRQMLYITKCEKRAHLQKLINWIDGRISFDKPYEPIFFSIYTSDKGDDHFNLMGDSSEIAIAYIYGQAIKTDIEKREFLERFRDPNDFSIEMALASYLVYLMRLANTVSTQIRALDHKGFFCTDIE